MPPAALFAAELGGGIGLLWHPRSGSAAELRCDVLIALLLVGIARAWELVGERDTRIFASIAAGRRTRPVLMPALRQENGRAGGPPATISSPRRMTGSFRFSDVRM